MCVQHSSEGSFGGYCVWVWPTHLSQRYWLNLGRVEPEHWNILYTWSVIIDVVLVELLHSVPCPL